MTSLLWRMLAAGWATNERRWLLLALELRDLGLDSSTAYARALTASERAVVCRAKARRR